MFWVFLLLTRYHNRTEEKSEGRLLSKIYEPLLDFPGIYLRLAHSFIYIDISWYMFCLSYPVCFFLWQLAWHYSETEKNVKYQDLKLFTFNEA